MPNTPIAHAFAAVAIGPAAVYRNLVMLPLLARNGPPEARPPDYLLLDDALVRGDVEITEVSERGSVPELRVVNRAPLPVLLVDGEELAGAKQNRVVNLTLLVPAGATLALPVSCVEAGRWRARSRAFSAAPRAQFASGRARRVRSVTNSMVMSGAYHSDQAEVWSDIAEKAARLQARSATSAMEALYTGHAEAIDAFVAACGPVDGQLGALFVVNGRVVSLDLFDSEVTLRRLLPKLVRSCAIEAIDPQSAGDQLPVTSGQGPTAQSTPGEHLAIGAAERFLQAVGASPQHVARARGLGDDVRVSGAGVTAAALVVDGRAVHVGAFAV
jgi:hypothetical protein